MSSPAGNSGQSADRYSTPGLASVGPAGPEAVERSVRPGHLNPPAVSRQPRLSAVVVHYNDVEHLLTCVDALRCDPEIDEIVVVDNASPGGGVETIAGRYRRVQVVQSPTNLGFGGGANLGAASATGELLVFLNPDTVPDPGCMTALAEHLLERGGVAGPVVRTDPGAPPEHGWTVDRMLLPRALDHVGEPLFVQGCCLATTRSCFDAVGGFDARYFLFQEDVEFCWQALRRGFAVDIVSGTGLFHVGGAVAEGGYRRAGRIETSSARILLRERNGWAVLLACAPGRSIPILAFLSVVRTVAFAGLFLRHGRPVDALRLGRGLLWNLVHLRGTLARRSRPGVTPASELLAWDRVARQLFLWDLARKGERVRFVDSGTSDPSS